MRHAPDWNCIHWGAGVRYRSAEHRKRKSEGKSTQGGPRDYSTYGTKHPAAVTSGFLGPVILAFIVTATPQTLSAQGDDREDGRGFNHVFVIMMENTGFDTLIGNPKAPFINAAAANYGLATNYFGVTHPSQPNYIAATSGGLNGVINDNDINININVINIVDQLESHGKTWKAYMQSLSLCTTKLDHACGNQLYERKHNPFVSYLDVQTNVDRMANIVDFSDFATDLAHNSVPDFVWISPDQCHDMHGRGGGGPSDSCDLARYKL